MLLILGLGVGTFLSIRIANRSAVEGFRLFTESLKGESDWILEAPGGIPVQTLPVIREALGSLPVEMFPVLERSLTRVPGNARGPAEGTASVRLLGLDLVQLRPVASLIEGQGDDSFWDILHQDDHLLLSPFLAEKWNLRIGESVRLILQGSTETFTLKGLLPEVLDGQPLPKNLAVIDLRALLQRLEKDTIDRVEFLVPEGQRRDQVVKAVGDILRTTEVHSGRLRSPRDQQVDGASMTAAFRLNLTVLSLIALLVGMYLIAQTLDATVSRRRREIATLRSLGIPSKEIFRLWIAEALLYGVAAGIIGILIGALLSTVTVEAVTTTVRALYRDTVQSATKVTSGDVISGLLLGIGGSFLAAWIPARDAASTPPAQFLRLGKRIPPFPIFQHPWMGTAAIIAGAGLLLLPPWQRGPGVQVPVAGYGAAFLWLTGGTLLTVGSLKWIGSGIHRCFRDSPTLILAGGSLRTPTSRHQLAVSGFFVAIAMAAAMTFLISSFQHTVQSWLTHRLRADLFISSIGFQGGDSAQRMPGELLDRLEREPGIAVMDRSRAVEIRIKDFNTSLAGARFDLLGDRQQLLWIRGPFDEDRRPDSAHATGYANENLGRRAGLSPGDLITLATPDGPKVIWIGGLHADYGRDNGVLLIDLPLLEAWYRISDYDTAGVFLEDGFSPAEVQARLMDQYPGLAIRQNAELLEAALTIFNQTFAVTRALQVIGLVVALAGLALGLLSLLRESSRELALQRTLGMSRHQIAMTTGLEGLGIALAGLIAGILLSLALGLMLVFVINRQSFGWTLQIAFPWADYALLGASVLLLSLVIGYVSGRLYLRKWKPDPL